MIQRLIENKTQWGRAGVCIVIFLFFERLFNGSANRPVGEDSANQTMGLSLAFTCGF